jgi:hypothetical protein
MLEYYKEVISSYKIVQNLLERVYTIETFLLTKYIELGKCSFHHMKRLLRNVFLHLSPFHCTSTSAPFVACTMSIRYSNALKLTHVLSMEQISYIKL